MKERPILFSGLMVRAIMEGRKTQTRQVAKFFNVESAMQFNPRWENGWWKAAHQGYECRCPYGVPGDRLWVRETFAPCMGGAEGPMNPTLYRADATDDYASLSWKPSIFMPRWASRITLKITAVRVERVQAITETDALAEGIVECWPGSWHWEKEVALRGGATPVEAYQTLWDCLHGEKHPWDSNPWVWVLEFRRLGR